MVALDMSRSSLAFIVGNNLLHFVTMSASSKLRPDDKTPARVVRCATRENISTKDQLI